MEVTKKKPDSFGLFLSHVKEKMFNLNILKIFLLDLTYLLALPAMACCFLWVMNEAYYRAFGRFKRKAVICTGVVGVTVHEVSHALMASLWGMYVNKIVFFNFDPESKTLGYVNYSYNPRSLIHCLGIVFTGFAPLIVGACLVYFIFDYSGLPNFNSYFQYSYQGSIQETINAGFLESVTNWLSDLYVSFNSPLDVLFFLLCLMIGVHSTPSRADLRGAMRGSFITLSFLFSLWYLMRLFPSYTTTYMRIFEGWMVDFGAAIIQLALISSVFAFSLTIVGLVLSVKKPTTFSN
ncbi:hypothetical protein [Marinomonas algarum]|uniref:Uncharacterized protein n=1 Tax=Marinomonas algarum TaxID=2883105 RepID=A0A9X1INS0_9GAMM|nr:hypothetical protein [Marinomonas algarum]MCB5162648.1 hypothetical protein [Marinomonas algarum]